MPQIKITLPDEVYKKIKEQAKEHYRTLSQEITFLIKYGESPESILTPTGLHYPPGVRSPENPEGRPVVTNDYNSYYKTAPRKTIID